MGWPLLQFASNHCELTASLIFQSSTIMQGSQHQWDVPNLNSLHHGYKRAVGEDFPGVVGHKPMISEEACIHIRQQYLKVVEESRNIDDGSIDFHRLMTEIESLL